MPSKPLCGSFLDLYRECHLIDEDFDLWRDTDWSTRTNRINAPWNTPGGKDHSEGWTVDDVLKVKQFIHQYWEEKDGTAFMRTKGDMYQEGRVLLCTWWSKRWRGWKVKEVVVQAQQAAGCSPYDLMRNEGERKVSKQI